MSSSFFSKLLPYLILLVLVIHSPSCIATATTTPVRSEIKHVHDATTELNLGLESTPFAATTIGDEVNHVHGPNKELNLGLESTPFYPLTDISDADIDEDIVWNLKEPSLNDGMFGLKATSTLRIVNPSSRLNKSLLEDIPCPSSCDSMCESHVNQFIRHLMAITTFDKVQLKQEIAIVIHLQRQERSGPGEDQVREFESRQSLASLSSMKADPQSFTIPVKEEEEKLNGKERHSYVAENDSYNSTSLILSSSFSRYQQRRLLDVTTIAWSSVTSSASWSARYSHSSVALDSNTIVLMGGWTGSSK